MALEVWKYCHWSDWRKTSKLCSYWRKTAISVYCLYCAAEKPFDVVR